jgi:hypothetical protein
MRTPRYVIDTERTPSGWLFITYRDRDGIRHTRKFAGYSLRDALALVRQYRDGGRA